MQHVVLLLAAWITFQAYYRLPCASCSSASGMILIGNLHAAVPDFIGTPNEGIRARDYHIRREATVQAALTVLYECGLLFMKAQPASGKTSMLQLLYIAAVESGRFDNFYVVDMGAAESTTFDAALAAKGLDWRHLESPPPSRDGEE